MEEGKKKKKKKRTGLKIFKIILITILSLAILGGVAGAGVTLAIVKTAPPLDINQILTLNEPSTIVDNADVFMDNVATSEKREIVKITDVPKALVDGFVSIEDERFYSHKGIDLQRIAGVIYIDIKSILTGSGNIQGASTITQQLIRNTMGLTKKADAKRKIQEMYLALELEKKLNKTEIIEAYMNTIPLGGTIYGVEAASKAYFNKPAIELNLMQCAYLAGVTQSPDRFSAFTQTGKTNPNLYLDRTRSVLAMMYKNNKITKEEYDKTISELSTEKLGFDIKVGTKNSDRLNFEWFSRPVVEQVKADLKTQYNYTDSEVNTLLANGGLKIYSTMDRKLQETSQAIINDDKNYKVASKPDAETGIVQPQASAVIMDYHTGEVKVIIGGRGNQPARSYNRAANNGSAPFFKPVGSAIKPITVYGATIDSKKGTAGTVVEDSPLPVEIGRQWPDGGKPWDPNNAESGSFQGYVTLREAIKSSINLVAIKQEYNIGLKTGSSYAEKFGLTLSKGDTTRMSAMALGELDDGENTLSMAAAYGTFGNDGLYTNPRLYTKVVDRSGNTILETKTETKKILSPQSAYIMFDLLQGPTSAGGTAPSAKFGSIPVAGKTGTSSKKKELWFCGVTPYLSGAVWIGHDKPEVFPKGISSSNAGQLWGKLMKEAHVGLSGKTVERPSGIRNVSICRESGKIPTDLCAKDPRGSQVYSEMFIEGTQPTTLCDIHVEAKVNKVNGKLASDLTPAELIESRVFIKRDYTPTKKLDDQEYVLPTLVDDTLPATPPPVTEPSNGGTDDGPDETEQPTQPSIPTTKPGNKPTVPPTKPNDSPNTTTTTNGN